MNGGAGGIGSIAIQIAKLHGAQVITTVSKDSFSFVEKLGADEVIDYITQDFDKKLNEIDAVFDTVGGEVTDRSINVLREGGSLVSMVTEPKPKLAKKKNIRTLQLNTNSNTNLLKRLAKYVDEGRVKPQVDKVFRLDETSKAFDYLENEHPRGKVMIRVN